MAMAEARQAPAEMPPAFAKYAAIDAHHADRYAMLMPNFGL